MLIRKIIASSFFVVVLLYLFVSSTLGQTLDLWPVLTLLFIYGLLIMSMGEGFSINWIYFVAASQILLIFYAGGLPTPYLWLKEHHVALGLAILLTIVYILATISIVLGLLHWLLELVRPKQHHHSHHHE